MTPEPYVTAEALEDCVRQAIHTHLLQRTGMREVSEGLFGDHPVLGEETAVMDFLLSAEVFEVLEEHVRREIESPSLKGPDWNWKLRRFLGRA